MSSADDFRVITFNHFMRAGGIEPDVARVKLLRHIETRNRIDVHDVWRNQRELFEAWQARQRDDFFNGVDCVAALVVSRAGETVFVGLYAVGAWTKLVAGTPDPTTGTPADPGAPSTNSPEFRTSTPTRIGSSSGGSTPGKPPADGNGRTATLSRRWRSPPSRKHPSLAGSFSSTRWTNWALCLEAGGRRCVRRRGSSC